MTLEDHVANLELSLKLRELGVPQESLFSWCRSAGEPSNLTERGSWNVQLDGPEENAPNSTEQCSAFLTSELGELLPKDVQGYNWRCLKTPRNGSYEIKYRKREPGIFHPVILHQLADPSETNARARMLIWLIQTRLVDPKDLETNHTTS